jgi:hypothetical protein
LHIEFYSPAPEHTETHRYNVALADLITESDAAMTASATSLALPDSVNRLSDVAPDSKATQLVLVNHFDFLCAVEQKGPDWHSYDRANTDLKFVANLFGSGIGFLTADPTIKSPNDLVGKRIAVLPRPSAVRAIAEIVLRDGWGILDQIELLDDRSASGSEASVSGSFDVRVVTTIEIQRGYKLVSTLSEGNDPSVNWIDVDDRAIDRMTAATGVTFDRLIHPPLRDGAIVPSDQGAQPEVGLVRFDEGLSAWDGTAPGVVAELLGLLIAEGSHWGESTGGMPFDAKRLRNWSPLDDSYIHQGAKQFYSDNGL